VSVNVQSAKWRVTISVIQSLPDGVPTYSWMLPARKGYAQSELIGSSTKQGNTRPTRSCFALNDSNESFRISSTKKQKKNSTHDNPTLPTTNPSFRWLHLRNDLPLPSPANPAGW